MRNNAWKRVTTNLEAVELQSSCYWLDKNFLDGSRISREAIKTNSKKFRWIENAMRSIEKRSPRVSMDNYLLRAIELDKNRFFKEEKNTQMNAIKHATQSKIQTIF